VWLNGGVDPTRTLVPCLVALLLPATIGFATTATLDSVDVQDLGDKLLATRDRTSPTEIRLESRERVEWIGARGTVGVALTDRRFLAVSDTSSGWQQVRLKGEDGAPSEVLLGANVALLVTLQRVFGFHGPSGIISEERFHSREGVASSGISEFVGVVVTDERAIGFAAGSPVPIERRFQIHESFESLRVLGTTATVRTSRRVLVFQSSTASWRDEEIRSN
jgi:hypothetical protein